MTEPPTGRGRRRAFGVVAASTFVVAGLTLLGVAGYEFAVPAHPPQLAGAGESGGLGDPTWDETSTSRLPDSTPKALRIPSIDVRTDLTELSMGDDDVLDAPTTGSKAGWYRSSPGPEGTSPTIIAGHLDWDDGPAVFYELGKLEPGDTAKVELATGRTATFTVHATRQYKKNDFPNDLVYGATRGAQLRLITCGGAFDGGHYVDNIVVFAHLTDVR